MKKDKEMPNIFDEISSHGEALLAIMDANPEFAMMLHIGQRISDEKLNGYTINAGHILTMVNALYIDLKEQIEAGEFGLFLELEEMLSVLRTELPEQFENIELLFDESDDELEESELPAINQQPPKKYTLH